MAEVRISVFHLRKEGAAFRAPLGPAHNPFTEVCLTPLAAWQNTSERKKVIHFSQQGISKHLLLLEHYSELPLLCGYKYMLSCHHQCICKDQKHSVLLREGAASVTNPA